ncbi:Phage tail fibre repeat-containing protein [Alteribacillus persepolensis]|uniref:Phage tail fibre repeat-containing protein n=1 Tax=Alteribacillus persepolensis TaxID=568899 RepID=A0A1G8ICR9_9BACI|nr:phage tail protein [Alteribacillus persepolensis]SDI16350.1 Phage tail fibre repeat-containing protein [Alteribacillus persepolensis]
MAEFNNPLPEWNATGIEPPQSKKDEGWQEQEKPPAQWHNWWMYTSYHAIQEMRTVINNLTAADVGAEPAFTKNTAFNKDFGTTAGTVAEGTHVSDTNNPHNVTTTQIGAETPSGAQSKADTAESNANTYTDGQTGDLSTLTTTEKTDLVGAINEVDGNADQVASDLTSHQGEDATLTQKGHVRLNSDNDSTDETTAATPKAVKAAYDKAISATSVAGTYTGTGDASQVISLGFRPTAVFVARADWPFMSIEGAVYSGFATSDRQHDKNLSDIVRVNSSGFTVYYDSDEDVQTNALNRVYNYFAIR